MRVWLHGSLLVALLTVTVACGGSSTAPGSTAPSRAPAEAATPPASAAAPSSSAGASTAPQTPDKIRVAYNAITADQTPIWLAQDAGIYQKHGLDVELVSMQSSAQITPALMSGELGIAYSAGAGTVAATLQGADLVMLSSFQPWLRFWLYTKPEITSVAQLRGTRMGVTRFGGGLHLAGLITVRRAGMDPERDLVMSQLGGNSEIFTALMGGAIDSGWVLPPQAYALEDAGFRRLVDTLDYRIPYTMSGATGSKRYISEHEDIVRRFIRAHMESLALFASDKELSKRVMAKWTGMDNPEYLERAYHDSLSSMELIPYTTPDTIQTMLDQLAEQIPAARTANPEDFIDNRFVREVVESNPPWLPTTPTAAGAQ
ncbi:MAG: ABC transporter substrate-binding protein [Chloroflexi bacterium]|nr:ABC transporter substrate-binding protein [Chloroflexota bacterium]